VSSLKEAQSALDEALLANHDADAYSTFKCCIFDFALGVVMVTAIQLDPGFYHYLKADLD
jgi:hypothetical protein